MLIDFIADLKPRTNKPAHEGESLLSLHLIPLTSHLL
ncbi:GSCOCG00004361001-RA-CDS [Cotesia congregata]|nr:GSCOCG00004361001-RA-CDS [Cotesia congregata]